MTKEPASSLFPDSPSSLPFVDYAWPSAAWNGLLLLGEAPGREEVRQGKPFVGRSGQLLDSMLEKAGIARASCLVANVFRYQPPGNKVDHFFLSKKAAMVAGENLASEWGKFGSLWLRAAFASEIVYLAGILNEKRPRLILALGRTPLWALAGVGGLLSLVGQELDCRLCPGVKFLPSFHPSFILRGNWAKQPEWLEHFFKARDYVA
jgi:DNA polymerase